MTKKKKVLTQKKWPQGAVYLWLSIKMAFCIVICSFLPIRRILGTMQEWFRPTMASSDIIRLLKRTKPDAATVNEFDPEGKTGLMWAIARADLPLVKAFVEAGADPTLHSRDDVGDTALHIACYSGSFYGEIPIIEYLINVKSLSDPHKYMVDVSARNKRGETPLLHATQISVIEERKKVMQWLVARGANINEQDDNGSTILHIAVNNKDDWGVQMLFDAFGDLINTNMVNKEGMTPQAYAWFLGFRDVSDRIRDNIEKIKEKARKVEVKLPVK